MIASFPILGDISQSKRLVEIMDDFSLFMKTKSATNPTMAYWLLYIEMVQVLLLFIRATRENNWELHLSAVRSMLPWFFAADRVNYSRYGSIYWLEMIALDKTHPGKLHEHRFFVKCSDWEPKMLLLYIVILYVLSLCTMPIACVDVFDFQCKISFYKKGNWEIFLKNAILHVFQEF